MGVNPPRDPSQLRVVSPNTSHMEVDVATTVKIEGCDSLSSAIQLKTWFERYGEITSDFKEEYHYDPDLTALPVGNGVFSVNMKITKQIPNFIPACGLKIRVSYTGSLKYCTNCYRVHPRRTCKNNKVTWIEYCARFLENNPGMGEEWFGRWWSITHKEFPLDQRSKTRQHPEQTQMEKQAHNQNLSPNYRENIQRRQNDSTSPLNSISPHATSSSHEINYDKYITNQLKELRIRNDNQINSQSTSNHPIPTENEIHYYMRKGLSREDANDYAINKMKMCELESRMRLNQDTN